MNEYRGFQEPIAIVGIGSIYPWGCSHEKFWENLLAGRRLFERVPGDKWDHSLYHNADFNAQDKTSIDIGSFIRNFTAIPQKYKILPSHEKHLPRLHLILLEAVSQALDDWQSRSCSFDPARTNIICGCSLGLDRVFANTARTFMPRFLKLLALAGDLTDENRQMLDRLEKEYVRLFPALPNDKLYEMASTIAAKISISHNIQGQCIVLECLDATSFKAFHASAISLRRRECDTAIVACGQLLESPLIYIAFDHKRVLSSTPMLPFTGKNDGYVMGEGAGVLILRRLSDAMQHEEKIYAVMTGIGMFHESKRGGLRYPSSPDSFRHAMEDAYIQANYCPETIDYIECFAPCLPNTLQAELMALEDLFRPYNRGRSSVGLGCIKELIGHTLANSGMAAVTKVALALYHGTWPCQHYGKEDFIALHTPFYIETQNLSWRKHEGLPRRAAVNGGGLGGECCHVLLEEYLPAYHSQFANLRVDVSFARSEKIAVVGLGGCFADAPDKESFWQNICSKKDSLRPVASHLLDRDTYYESDYYNIHKTYTDIGSTISDDLLELSGFKILPAQIEYMDKAQKLALRIAHEAIADYGVPDLRSLPARTAVILASALCLPLEKKYYLRILAPELEPLVKNSDFFQSLPLHNRKKLLQSLWCALSKETLPIASWSLDGFVSSGIAMNIANYYGIGGNCMVAEAACASSIAAIALGIQGLQSGEYDLVLSGGVELPICERELVLASNARFLSHSKIRPFDTRADGFSLGEGGAIFILKRLPDALHDKDKIYAIIVGMGNSSDAHSLIAPSVEGQILAMQRAFAKANISPSTIQFMEAHGTGTRLGDTVETQAIKEVYGYHRSTPLALGSIKSMIGHTWSAAGAASMLKTILALSNRQMPPNINFDRASPELKLEEIPAYVNTELKPWPENGNNPRRAALSSFGTGGLNYHILIEE